MLLIDMFGHDVKQPSPYDVMSTNLDLFVFPTSLDKEFHTGKSLHWQINKSSLKGRQRQV